jgi:two-component system, OmpR family, KDP operon response regulator KdpE
MKVIIIGGKDQILKDVTFCLQVRYPEIMILNISEGIQGLKTLEMESPDLVLVDSSLPDIKTLDLIVKVRDFSDVALVILSSQQTELERAELLEAGADDYVNMPFSPIEFLSKIAALLRRTMRTGFKAHRVLTIGNITVDFNAHEVFSSGKRVHLTPIEYNLLLELIRNPGSVLTNDMLLEKIWGSEYSDGQSFGFVKKYVHRLRTKLEDDSNSPRLIVNERGVGYKFVKLI